MNIPFGRSAAFLALVLVAAIPCLAEPNPAPTLKLEEAIERAILHNPNLKAAKAKIGISDAELVTAGKRLNPILMSDNGIAEKTYRLGITQTIELGGKRRQRMAVSKAQRDVTVAEANAELLEIRSGVRKAFIELYYAQEKQSAQTKMLALTQDLITLAKEQESAGNISSLDVLQTEIENVNADNELQNNRLQVLQAQNRLASLMNETLQENTRLAEPDFLSHTLFPETGDASADGLQHPQTDGQLERLIDQAFRQRPETQRITTGMAVAKAQLSLARSNRIPNLTVSAGPDLVVDPNDLSAFIMGNMEIPLFDRQQGPLAEAGAKLSQMEQEMEAARNVIRLEVSNAYAACILNREKTKRYKERLLPYTAMIVEKSNLALKEGKTSVVIPIHAQKTFFSTRLAYLQAMLDFQNALADLEKALGITP